MKMWLLGLLFQLVISSALGLISYALALNLGVPVDETGARIAGWFFASGFFAALPMPRWAKR